MRRGYLPGGSGPISLLRAGGLLLAGAALVAGAVFQQPLWAIGMLTAAGLCAHLVVRSRLAAVADRLATLARIQKHGSVWIILARATDCIEDRLRSNDDRLDQRHALTGLPTREPLLARMEADGAGTLGLVALSDFDRLCAFDPALADRTLKQFAERITRMIGGDRMVAHVDRAHFALWFGPQTTAQEVGQQLVAIGYALGGTMHDEGRELLPEVRVHHASWSADEEVSQATLARVLAACAVTEGPLQVQRIDGISASAERDRYALEQDLRQATARRELRLDFQPLIDAGRGRVCGAEALIRWDHARARHDPARHASSRSSRRWGMASEIGMWALNAAAREAQSWAGAEASRSARRGQRVRAPTRTRRSADPGPAHAGAP